MICTVCAREPEPGWVEMDNNGPIVPCWGCNRELWKVDVRYPRATPPREGDSGARGYGAGTRNNGDNHE